MYGGELHWTFLFNSDSMLRNPNKYFFNLLFMIIIVQNLQGSNGCVLMQLDRNFGFSGEQIRGALHINGCYNISDITLGLQNDRGTLISDVRFKVYNPPEAFRLQVPATTIEGIYRLVAFSSLSCEVYYQRDFPIFNLKEFIPDDLETTLIMETDARIDEAGQAITLEWRKYQAGSDSGVEIDIKTSAELPVRLSFKIADNAQSIPDNLSEYSLSVQPDAGVLSEPSNGFSFSGNLKLIDNSCQYCPVVLTIPEVENGIYYTLTDDKGDFVFTGLHHFGSKKAYLWSPRYALGRLEFTVEARSCLPGFEKVQSDMESVKADWGPDLVRKLLVQNVEYENCLDETLTVPEPMVTNQIVMFPQFNSQVIFDDYFLDSDMRETLKRIAPNVNFVRKDQIRIFSYDQSKNFPDTPFILLDGLPITDSVLLTIDPRSVQRVDVIHRTRSLREIGNLARNGILSVVSKGGTDYEQIAGVEKLYVSGYNNQNTDNQTYSKCKLSPVLYWNPRLIIDQPVTKIRIPMPSYYVESTISVVGFDSNGAHVFYQGNIP